VVGSSYLIAIIRVAPRGLGVAVAVESWLSTLKKDDGTTQPMVRKRRSDLMHLLYERSIRYEWTDCNPITSVGKVACARQRPSAAALTNFRNLSTVS